MKILLFITSLIILCSCESQPELCFDHSSHDRKPVQVVFDWSDCPDADPASMTLYIFPDNGDATRRYDFDGREGGEFRILPGHYTAIAINSDTEKTTIRNTQSPETFEVWLRGDFAAPQQVEEELLCNQSDMVWLGEIQSFDTSEGRVEIIMHEAVCRCTVDILKIDNHNRVKSVSATLSGMNESIYVRNSTAEIKSAKIALDMYSPGPGSLHGSMLTLGHCGQARARGTPTDCHRTHQLQIFFSLDDGTGRLHTIDVSEQMHSQDVDDCHIVIDSISVPVSGNATGGGGLSFEVDDWDVIDITIKP